MNRLTKSVVLFGLLATSASVAYAIQPDFPHRFRGRHADVWVSASTAVDSEGNLRGDVVGAQTVDHLRFVILTSREANQRLKATKDEPVPTVAPVCDVLVTATADSLPSSTRLTDWEQLAAAMRDSRALLGEVTNVSVGLYGGLAFTVLQLRLTPQGDPGWAYLLYPRASIDLKEGTICTEFRGYPQVPSRGDTILFVSGAPLDEDHTLYFTTPDRLFIQHGAELWLPPALREKPDTSDIRDLNDVTRRIAIPAIRSRHPAP